MILRLTFSIRELRGKKPRTPYKNSIRSKVREPRWNEIFDTFFHARKSELHHVKKYFHYYYLHTNEPFLCFWPKFLFHIAIFNVAHRTVFIRLFQAFFAQKRRSFFSQINMLRQYNIKLKWNDLLLNPRAASRLAASMTRQFNKLNTITPN